MNNGLGNSRIHSELLKLGISVSQATVAEYMVRHPKSPSQNWRTFLTNHLSQLVSVDFFTGIAFGQIMFRGNFEHDVCTNW